jgi:hypothetical protein
MIDDTMIQNDRRGRVIERAAILAEGAESIAIREWIIAQCGQPEVVTPGIARKNLHGERMDRRRGRGAAFVV